MKQKILRSACLNKALNKAANSENSAVATRLEKISFQPSTKKDNANVLWLESSRMFKLLHNAENSPSQASTVPELRISRCSSWI